MARDTLFVLKERFSDSNDRNSGESFFCPQCAEISGVLSYFPELRHNLDVRYVDFQRPRAGIVELLGQSHQGCPVLVLASEPTEETKSLVTGNVNGNWFISGPREIARYWAVTRGTSRPH